MSERDEQEIETRLRAAFQARSELVTHQKLRPGVPPNAHTAAKQGKRRGWALSWRAALVPVSVAAALAGGVFVGAKLPNHSGAEHGGVQAGSNGSRTGLQSGQPVSSPAGGQQTVASAPATAPSASLNSSPSSASAPAATEKTFAGLAFQPADWQLAPLDATTACLLPAGHEAPDKSAVLPCGVDSLLISTDAAADAWPVSTANLKEGWWPKAADANANASTTVPCPGSKASAKNPVKSSATLRTDPKFPLAGAIVADYREWTVTCTDGSGAVPRLWQVKGPKDLAVTAVSVNARYDGALLQIVGSMHPVNS